MNGPKPVIECQHHVARPCDILDALNLITQVQDEAFLGVLDDWQCPRKSVWSRYGHLVVQLIVGVGAL